jgi:hypothetical protein
MPVQNPGPLCYLADRFLKRDQRSCRDPARARLGRQAFLRVTRRKCPAGFACLSVPRKPDVIPREVMIRFGLVGDIAPLGRAIEAISCGLSSERVAYGARSPLRLSNVMQTCAHLQRSGSLPRAAQSFPNNGFPLLWRCLSIGAHVQWHCGRDIPSAPLKT